VTSLSRRSRSSFRRRSGFGAGDGRRSAFHSASNFGRSAFDSASDFGRSAFNGGGGLGHDVLDGGRDFSGGSFRSRSSGRLGAGSEGEGNGGSREGANDHVGLHLPIRPTLTGLLAFAHS
jgi:hypothetical protein